MTISFLQTARYNAQPRLAHLDDGQAKPTPQFDSLDDLIAAMHKDAAKTRKILGSKEHRDIAQDPTPEGDILDAIAANPGITGAEIAAQVGKSRSNIAARLCSMEARGQCRTEKELIDGCWRKRFYPVANPPKAKNGRPARKSPVRDKVIAFIRSNPGCTTPQLSDYMKCSNKMGAAHIAETRKAVKITSKRIGGNNTPMAHWVQE